MEINLYYVQNWNKGEFYGHLIGVYTSYEKAREAKEKWFKEKTFNAPSLALIDIEEIKTNEENQ